MASTSKRRRPNTCPGSGRRTRPTGSSAFPEVRCPNCEYEARPVYKFGEHAIRAHRPLGAWRP